MDYVRTIISYHKSEVWVAMFAGLARGGKNK